MENFLDNKEHDNSIPLNQLYKSKATMETNSTVKYYYDMLNDFATNNKFYIKHADGSIRLKGRRYDNAIFLSSGIDFNGKTVCELGARDGIFSSWLTQYVDKIYTSDYFEEWGKGTAYDLGGLHYWESIWKSAACDPDRLIAETQDITRLTYEDNMFDIVVCSSVIEHMFPQAGYLGDMVAIREIVRITKPGGIICLSTDMTSGKSKWHGGTFYYNIVDLFDRIINPSRCLLRGEYNFDFNDKLNDDLHEISGVGLCSSVVFTLIKP